MVGLNVEHDVQTHKITPLTLFLFSDPAAIVMTIQEPIFRVEKFKATF